MTCANIRYLKQVLNLPSRNLVPVQWIWHGAERRNWNEWVQFRKEFELAQVPRELELRITADARYVLWVNGEWVGQGPIRAFPSNWKYDVYDIAQYLRTGLNCVAVEVQSLGICTFQYIISDAGLACECEHFAADGDWKCRKDPFRAEQRFKIACQQGWQEILELGPEPNWKLAGFDDDPWARAMPVLDTRPLSRSEVALAVIEEVRPLAATMATVKPPATIWSIALRESLLPGFVGAEPKAVQGLVGVLFHVKHEAAVQFELTGSWFWIQAPGRLNGNDLEKAETGHNPWANGVGLRGTTRQGDNFVVFNVSGTFHEWHLNVVVDDLLLEHPQFFIAGPFDDEAEAVPLWAARSLADWSGHPKVHSIARSQLAPPEGTAFSRTAHARTLNELGTVDPKRIYFGETLTRAFLELPRMTSGFWAFDIECKVDTTLYCNAFEAIQEGRPDYCWEMSNTLELRLKAGRYKYRSPQRRGARYLDIQGTHAVLSDFRVIESTYPSKQDIPLRTDNDLINGIFDMCALTTRLCSEDTFVDCPTYEQTFWVGDARNEALIAYAIYGDWPLAKHCWELAAESLDRSPLVECHVPSGWQSIIPAWSFLWAMGCWEYYFYTGDSEFLKRIYPRMRQQLLNCEKYIDANGLFSIKAWNLCDWAAMDQPNEGVVTHNQGWLALAIDATSRCAKELGKNDEEACYNVLKTSIAKACNEHLWSDEEGAFTDCIKFDTGAQSNVFSVQTQVVLSLAGIPEPERQKRLDSLILAPPDEFVQVGSPFFMFFLFEYMERLGEYETVLKMTRENWGMMLERGATTCWEVFPGFMHKGRWTRSHCHAWSAAPGYFLTRHQLGITPTSVGFRTAKFDPKPLGLTKCEGAVPTPYGPIEVSWEIIAGELKHRVQAPKSIRIEFE